MSFAELKEITDKVTFADWTLRLIDINGAFLIQWTFMQRDLCNPDDTTLYEQHCRKWYVSSYSTPSEVIRTCWLAVAQAVLHEAGEQFLYEGVQLFDPHMDYLNLAQQMPLIGRDVRKPIINT